jgi:DNA-binding Lrp family transcriptional regulator
VAYPLLDDVDRRLVGALQVDGRASPEQLADALDLPVRTVTRLLAALLRDGTIRVTAVPPRDPGQRTSVVRVTVRHGKADAIAAALARRADVPFVDVASTGEEVGAFVVAGDGARSRLLSDLAGQVADAVIDVTAQTVLRIHAEAHQWRLPGLSKQVREALGDPVRSDGLVPQAADETEARIRAVLEADGRASAATNLHVVVWLRDLDALYEFITADLAGLNVSAAETTLVGRVVKRPGMRVRA